MEAYAVPGKSDEFGIHIFSEPVLCDFTYIIKLNGQ
jgi:hypothetical protein